LAIFLQFSQGGNKLLGGSAFSVPSLRWVGITSSDVEQLISDRLMTDDDGVAFTPRDHVLCDKLIGNPAISADSSYVDQVHRMKERSLKYELQTVLKKDFNYLANVLIPNKLRRL
jgi:DNA topoisomerase VI subunit A